MEIVQAFCVLATGQHMAMLSIMDRVSFIEIIHQW